MAYVIAEPCVGTKDTACVDACPVDCIHPRRTRPVAASSWSSTLGGLDTGLTLGLTELVFSASLLGKQPR